MHHDGVHPVGHGEGLEVGLDGHGEGQLVDEVDRCTGDNRAAAQVLEAEDCGRADTNWDYTLVACYTAEPQYSQRIGGTMPLATSVTEIRIK